MAVVEFSKEGTFLSDKENIGKITLNRPDKYNALSMEVLEGISDALDQAEEDDEIRALVFTGAGDAFSAGADLTSLGGLDEEDLDEFLKFGQELFRRIENFPKASVAAVNGTCLGGGLELASACDLRVASEEAKVGFPEVSIGLIPAWGGSQRMPYLIGVSKARELVLTGNRYPAEELLEFGLFSKVVPEDELESTASFLAAKIADNAPLAVKKAKQSMLKSRDISIEEGNEYEFQAVKELQQTKDLQEGIEAFQQKRKPKFEGK